MPTKIKMTTKERDRLSELEEKARDKFIECSGEYVNPAEWLRPHEAEEWKKLYAKFLKT